MFMADEIVADQARQMIESSYGYALEAIRARLETKTDDFLSEILWDQVSRDGAVDINFQVAQLINLIGAGSETTAHLLTNTMLLLCRHQPVLDQVRADRSLLRPLIEESMRLETPVQWLPRLATGNAVVGGVEIPAGATLWLLWAAGNRDPDKWEAPHELRLDRPGLAQNQLGFGRGPHLCVGAPLARLESTIAVDRILTRLEDLNVLEGRSDLSNVMKSPPSSLEGIYDASGSMRGPKTLVLAFRPAQAGSTSTRP
jgi:cytochrome P450